MYLYHEKYFRRIIGEKENSDGLEKVDGSYFGADEAYKHQNWNELLLRKDDTILFIDSEEIDARIKIGHIEWRFEL